MPERALGRYLCRRALHALQRCRQQIGKILEIHRRRTVGATERPAQGGQQAAGARHCILRIGRVGGALAPGAAPPFLLRGLLLTLLADLRHVGECGAQAGFPLRVGSQHVADHVAHHGGALIARRGLLLLGGLDRRRARSIRACPSERRRCLSHRR